MRVGDADDRRCKNSRDSQHIARILNDQITTTISLEMDGVYHRRQERALKAERYAAEPFD